MSAVTNITTAAALKTLLGPKSTATGAYYVRGEASGVGLLDLGAKSPDRLIVEFEDGWTWAGAAGSPNPAVAWHSRGVELYGGDVSNPHGGKVGVGGGDGVKVTDSSADGGTVGGRWWGLSIHDVAAQGFSSQANVYAHELDADYETARCGLNIALDPHTEPGTGLHGSYIGGGSHPTTGRVKVYAHDQPTGSGVQVGAYAQNLALHITAARMTWPKASAGAAFQPWGSHNTTVTVEFLGVDHAQYGIWAASLSSGAVTVQNYARSNVVHPDYLNSHVVIKP